MMIRSAARPDRDAIAALLERRKLFTREEMSVALEVIDTALDHPEKEDYFVRGLLKPTWTATSVSVRCR